MVYSRLDFDARGAEGSSRQRYVGAGKGKEKH